MNAAAVELALFQQITFFTVTAIFTWFDFNPNKRLALMQPETKKRFKYNYSGMFALTCFNCFFCTVPLGLFVTANFFIPYDQLKWIASWSACGNQFLRLLACFILEDVLFYYIHRFMHLPFCYGWWHKLHHHFMAPVALATLYVHPIEHCLLNLFPVMALAVFLQLQGEMLYLWFFIATVNSIVSHCGYAIASNFHDVHHAEHKVNFGTFGLSDWWHHTYKINH